MTNVVAFPTRLRSEDQPRLDHARHPAHQPRNPGQGARVAHRDAHQIACSALMVVPLTMAALSLVIVLLAREILDHSQRLLKSALHLASSRHSYPQSAPETRAIPGQIAAKIGGPP